jgi:hypothetical protein
MIDHLIEENRVFKCSLRKRECNGPNLNSQPSSSESLVRYSVSKVSGTSKFDPILPPFSNLLKHQVTISMIATFSSNSPYFRPKFVLILFREQKFTTEIHNYVLFVIL